MTVEQLEQFLKNVMEMQAEAIELQSRAPWVGYDPDAMRIWEENQAGA